MPSPIKYSINALLVVLLISLLAGCGDPHIKTERPFHNGEQLIQIGSTTQAEVRGILGQPYDQDPSGYWEVYRRLGDGIAFAGIVPFPAKNGWVHYLLIAYDKLGRVSALGHAERWASSVNEPYGAWGQPAVYAGDYGYYTGTDVEFPSVDGGGEADEAWRGYLSGSAFYSRTNKYRDSMLQSICDAAKLGHPSAFNELGNYFWEGTTPPYNFFIKDNAKACAWYAMANNKALTSTCKNTLTAMQATEVNRLLVDWQPSQCEIDITSQLSGNSHYPRKSVEIISTAYDSAPQNTWGDVSSIDAKLSLCRAADSGHPEAKFVLGVLYEKGQEGFPIDPVRAYMWYRISASTANYKKAALQAERLLKELSREQENQAEILVREWKPGQCER